MRVAYDYTDLLKNFLTDLNQTSITDDDYIYVVRGDEQHKYDNHSDDTVRYRPIIEYFLYLDKIDERISYERIKVIDVIDELVTLNI